MVRIIRYSLLSQSTISTYDSLDMSSSLNDAARNVTGISTNPETPLILNRTYIYGLVLCTVSVNKILA